jgi:hypothetical protein
MIRLTITFAALLGMFMCPIVFAETATFTLPSGVAVRIVEAPFKASMFKVQNCMDEEMPCLINGHVPFGVGHGFPRTYLKSITVSFEKRSYSLDVSDMYNAWGNRPLEVKGVVRYFGGRCFDAMNCHFRGLFADAGASFVAEWHIVEGVPSRTVLTASDDVVNLFMENIDPPVLE